MATVNADIQSNNDADIEDALAAKLSAKGDDEDLPVRKSVEKEPEDEGQPKSKAEEAGDSESDDEDDDPDAEEFEFDGKTYKAPKELKEAVLRHKDYTEKTMQTAEERKLLVQEREFLKVQSDFQGKFADAIADHRSMQAQLKQYEAVDWTELANANQAQYLALDRQERTLREKFNQKTQELQRIAAQYQHETEAQRQKRLVLGREMLRKEFKDESADLGDRLVKTGEGYGFTRQELELMDDPRQARVLRDAMKWRELQTSKPTINKRAENVAPVKVNAARSSQNTKFAADVDSAKSRFQKSKSSQDAEDYLTRLLSRKR
jgi:hypothetical protein